MTESEKAGYFCYWLVEGQKEPTKAPFFLGENSIGRNKDNKIIIPNQGTSKYHGKLIVKPMSMSYIDLGGRNGTKFGSDSEDNLLSPKTEVNVFDGTILYLGEIKCQIQRLPFKDNEETLPTGQQHKKSKAVQQIFDLVFSEENEEPIKLNPKENTTKNKEEDIKSKQANVSNIEIDQFSITDDFNGMNKKEKNKNGKKQKDTKKTGKAAKLQKVQIKQDNNKPEQNQPNKKRQKKELLEKPNAQKSLEKDNEDPKQAPSKYIKKQKPKQLKLEKNDPIDKNQRKSKEKEQQKKRQAEKEEQLKKEELLRKEELKNKEKQERKKRQKQEQEKKQKQQQKIKQNKKNQDRQTSKQKTNKRKSRQKQTDAEVDQAEAPLNVSRRNLRSNAHEKVQQGQDTKRRVSQHRKRLPSEIVSVEGQCYPLRKSFVNKRVLISGFVPNLTKKYFCIVDKIQDEFDYLVMKEYKRTFKALYAICRGINILRYEWIKDSEFFEKTLKPDGYIFKDSEYIYHSIERANEGFRVFKGLQFYLGSEQYHLKIEDIEALIYAGGGEMMKKIGKLQPKEKESKNKIAIIRNMDEKNHKIHEEELKRVKKLGFDEIHSIEMVLDSCQKQQIDWQKNKFSPK